MELSLARQQTRLFARVLSAALAFVAPAEALADCSSAMESFSYAYKAYNDCSAAGKGAAGCAAQTAAYDAARQQLDNCRAQGSGGVSTPDSDFRRRFEESPRPERDSDNGDRDSRLQRAPQGWRAR